MKAFIANAKGKSALAVIRSLGKNNIEITAATDRKNDFAIFSKYCKQRIFFKTEVNNQEDRVDELLTIIKNDKFDVFLPVISEKILRILSRRRKEFEKYTRLPIVDPDIFDVFDNKAKTMKLCMAQNVPCPKTYFVENEFQVEQIKNDIEYPVLIKPHYGEGSNGIKSVSDGSNLTATYSLIKDIYGPSILQEFVCGVKYAAVFLVDKKTDPKRFFIHKCIREYPITGGPICCLESVHVDLIFDYGLKLLKAINYFGIAQVEFIIDEKDNKPKITEINPRFYGCLQGAISSGVDFPFEFFRLVMGENIQADFSYKLGIRCRQLLFDDSMHLLSVLRGVKTSKYQLGKLRTLINYLKFHEDDAYYILSLDDPIPALVRLSNIFYKIPKVS